MVSSLRSRRFSIPALAFAFSLCLASAAGADAGSTAVEGRSSNGAAAASQAPAAKAAQNDASAMPRIGIGDIRESAPPAADGGASLLGEQTGDATLGSRGRKGVKPKRRTRCVRRQGARICKTYNAGRLVKRCVRRNGRRSCRRFKLLSKGAAGSARVPARASALSWHGWPSQTAPAVGKIYFTKANGATSKCSGTVVAPTVVLTAAHCLYDASTGGFIKALTFVPGMTWNDTGDPNSVSMPYGSWAGSRWWVPQGYTQGDAGADFGLVEVPAQNGYTINQYTGSWPVVYDYPWKTGTRIYSMGYPASGFWAGGGGYHGRGQYACDGTWDGQWSYINNGWELYQPCYMNGGASGGPWFVQLANGNWAVAGVNDRCHGPSMNDPSAYCTPYSWYLRASNFDREFLDFWNSVFGG